MAFKNVGRIHVYFPNALDVKAGKVALWDRIFILALHALHTLALAEFVAERRDHAFAFAPSIVWVPSCSRSISNAR